MPASLFACPSCKSPSAAITAVQDCVVTAPVTFSANAHGEPVASVGEMTIDRESLANVRYQCAGCDSEWDVPLDLNAPEVAPGFDRLPHVLDGVDA